MTDQEAGTEDRVGVDTRIDLLASSRAALSSDRRELRSDISLSTVLSVLAGRGPCAEKELHDAVASVWKTNTLTGPVLRRSLADGESAGLVLRQEGLDGVERLTLTEVAEHEVTDDRAWAETTLREFEQQVWERLTDYDDEKIESRSARITQHVLEAIARSVDGQYAVKAPAATPQLRPVNVNFGDLDAYVRSIEPKSLREPTSDIARDAVDPADEFGNEIVHLIVAGSLLQGVVAQRGLDTRPDLAGIRLLVDTSALVSLVGGDKDSERRVLVESIAYSGRLGAEVIVAEHSVDEWTRLWQAADAQAKGAQLDKRERIPSLSSRIAGHPFLKAYLEHRESGGTQTFNQWAKPKRNLVSLMKKLGVNVREHGNKRPEDLELQGQVKARLLELAADSRTYARRSPAAADADAHSCAMVVRWRERNGEDNAFFLAVDTWTARVHQELYPSAAPLVINPNAWLLYVANLATDDPDEAASIADLVADAMVRSTVLSLAGSHTLSDVMTMADILTREGESITARDIRDLQDESLFEHLERLEDDEDVSPAERASLVLQRRANRTSQRARRAQATVDQTIADLTHAAEARVGAEEKRAELAEERATSKDAELTLLKRRGLTGIFAIVVLASAIGLLATDAISARVFWISIVALMLAVAYAWEALVDATVPIRRVVIPFILWAGAVALSQLLSGGFPSW